jgi:hypothetical protein
MLTAMNDYFESASQTMAALWGTLLKHAIPMYKQQRVYFHVYDVHLPHL